MAEYSANTIQIVNPGETIVFTDAPDPCRRGFVRHRDGTGNFLLSGWVPNQYCPCAKRSAEYLVDFGANISIPAGGTVGPNMGDHRGYSGHSIKDRMVDRLESMMDEAHSDYERQAIAEWIAKIQN